MSFNVIHEYNLSHSQTSSQIAAILDKNDDVYGACKISCVAIKNNDGRWNNALCVIRAYKQDDRPIARSPIYYNNCLLIEEIVTPDTVNTIIQNITSGIIKINSADIYIGDNNFFREKWFLMRDNDYSRFPGTLFSTSDNRSVNISYEKLLHYNKPYFPDIITAIKDWIQLNDFHGNNDARLKAVHIFLPEYEAYFNNITYDEDETKILINVVNNTQRKELYITGGFTSAGRYINLFNRISGKDIEFTIHPDEKRNAQGYEFFLMDNEDNIYDQFSGDVVTQSQLDISTVESVKQIIQNGESHLVEFKPYISHGNHKINEVIETIIAFSNTDGGDLFLGVTDYVEITGIENDIVKDNKYHDESLLHKTIETKLLHYIGYIKKQVSDSLNRKPLIEVTQHEINGHIVLRIKVHRGDGKPYYKIGTTEMYIRKGANNVRPNPDTEIPALYRE